MATQNLMLGDCLEWMKSLPDKYYDLAICDPEYGADDAIQTNKSNSKNKVAKRKEYKVFKNIAPDQEYWIELKRICKNQIVWGGNYFGLKGGVIVWNKNGTAFGEGEVAICSTHKSVRFFEYTWNGMIQQDMKNKQDRIHPTEKPIALYKWLLTNYAKTGQKIFDSHGGSFSHAIAAYDLGFDLDIIEIDPDYFRDGKARYDAHVTKCEEIKQFGFAKTKLSKTNPTLF